MTATTTTIPSQLSDEDILDLALSPKTAPLHRMVLFAIERADENNVANFDQGELRELLSKGSGTDHTKALMKMAVGHGWIRQGSTTTRLMLTAGMRKIRSDLHG